MMYELQGSIVLDPILWKDPPLVAVALDQQLIYKDYITASFSLPLDFKLSEGTHSISVELCNKKEDDTDLARGLDKAVNIRHIEFFGISDPRFVWAGHYHPIYHPSWIDQQKQNGIVPEPVLTQHTYLGWNGIWYLDFSVPIFTWMHKIQSLGWIYD